VKRSIWRCARGELDFLEKGRKFTRGGEEEEGGGPGCKTQSGRKGNKKGGKKRRFD